MRRPSSCRSSGSTSATPRSTPPRTTMWTIRSALCVQQTTLLDVRVRLVLGEEHEALVHGPQEHAGHLDPVLRLRLTPASHSHLLAAQQRLQVRPPHIREGALVHVLRAVQQPDGHVPAQERHPLQQEAPRARHARLVAAPVFQPVVAEGLDDLQPLARADVPVACASLAPAAPTPLLQLRQQPRLDQRAAARHHGGQQP